MYIFLFVNFVFMSPASFSTWFCVFFMDSKNSL